MNCDLWRSHGRLLVHWSCLCIGRNFVSGFRKLKPKNLKSKNLIVVLKTRFYSSPDENTRQKHLFGNRLLPDKNCFRRALRNAAIEVYEV